jgi:hypothetical protein
MADGRTPRATRAGIGLWTAGVFAVGISYAMAIFGTGGRAASSLLAFGAALSSVALFVLGAATRHTLGRGVGACLVALFLVMLGAFGAAIVLPAGTATEPILLGLPLRLAIVLYGVGVLPLFVLPAVFAATFDDGERADASGNNA